MGLWRTRHKSMEWLAKGFKPQATAIVDAFGIIDGRIDLFDSNSDNDFCRVFGITLAKARNFALGAYGLILDAVSNKY